MAYFLGLGMRRQVSIEITALIILCAWACFFYVARQYHWQLGWIGFYANDLICIPFINLLTLRAMKWIYGPNYRIPVWQVCTSVIVFSVLFEGILPIYTKTYTADILDVVCYLAGGVMYIVLFYHQKNASTFQDSVPVP